jgi:hypothetical protein
MGSSSVTIKYSQGVTYFGSVNENYLPSGEGTITFNHNDIFYGKFENGLPK